MLLTGMDDHQVGMGTLVETVPKKARERLGYSMLWSEGQTTMQACSRKRGIEPMSPVNGDSAIRAQTCPTGSAFTGPI